MRDGSMLIFEYSCRLLFYRRDLLDISQVLIEAGSAIIDVCTVFMP